MHPYSWISNLQKNKMTLLFRRVKVSTVVVAHLTIRQVPVSSPHNVWGRKGPLKVMSKPHAQSRTSFWKSQMETLQPLGQWLPIALNSKRYLMFTASSLYPLPCENRTSLHLIQNEALQDCGPGHLLKGSTQMFLYVRYELNPNI